MESFKKIANEIIGKIKPEKSKKERYIEEIKAQFIELRCPICNSLYKLKHIKQYHFGMEFTCLQCDRNEYNDYRWVDVILKRSFWGPKWKVSRVNIKMNENEEGLMLKNGERNVD